MNRILNFILFQLLWFAAVMGAADGLYWAGPAALLGFALWQLSISRVLRRDLRVMVAALVMGLIFDSLLITLGLADYAAAWPHAELAPVWILSMWMGFALTLNHSLDWLQGRSPLAVALGAIGGPLAYSAGQALGAVEFVEPPWPVLTVIAVGWALATPALVRIAALEPGGPTQEVNP